MARSTTDFADVARQNTERAVHATNWMCAVAEQNLIQNKAVFEGLLTIARNTLRSIDQQSSAISEHSIAVAEQALSNAFDFSHKVLRIKDPQQLAQIQSEFISRLPVRTPGVGAQRPRASRTSRQASNQAARSGRHL